MDKKALTIFIQFSTSYFCSVGRACDTSITLFAEGYDPFKKFAQSMTINNIQLLYSTSDTWGVRSYLFIVITLRSTLTSSSRRSVCVYVTAFTPCGLIRLHALNGIQMWIFSLTGVRRLSPATFASLVASVDQSLWREFSIVVLLINQSFSRTDSWVVFSWVH